MNRRYSHQMNRKAATSRATRIEYFSQPGRCSPSPPCPAAASCGSASHVNVVWPLASNTSNSTPAIGNSTESEQAKLRTLNRHLPFTKWRMAENVTPPKAGGGGGGGGGGSAGQRPGGAGGAARN